MSMGGLDPAISLADNYRVWAKEAKGRSPAYVTLSNSVADDPAILEFLLTLPQDKRQPDLLFASARYLLGTPADPGTLRKLVDRDQDALTQVVRLTRFRERHPGGGHRRWRFRNDAGPHTGTGRRGRHHPLHVEGTARQARRAYGGTPGPAGRRG
jgi:hypothetical protein